MADYSDLYSALGVQDTTPGVDYVRYLLDERRPEFAPNDLQLPPPPPAAVVKPGKMPKTAAPVQMNYEQETRANQAAAEQAIMAKSRLEAARESEIAEKQSLEQAASLNRQREMEDQRTRDVADLDQRQAKILSDYDQLSKKKLDPMGGMTGGEKFTIGLVAFLSGFAEKNPAQGAKTAQAIVNNEVQRRVAIQMAEIEREERKLGLKNQTLGQEYGRTNTNADMRLRAELQALDTVNKQIVSQANRLGGPIAEANMQALLANNRQEYAAKIQQWRDNEDQKKLQKSAQGIGYGNLKLARDQFEYGKQKDQEDRDLKRELAQDAAATKQGRIPEGGILNTGQDGGYSQLISKDLVAKATERKMGYEQTIALNRRMLELIKAHPGHQWSNFITTEEGKQLMEQTADDMVLADAMKNGQGALGDEERANRKKALLGGEIGTFFSGSRADNPQVFLENIRKAEADYNRYMRTVAIGWPRDRGYSFDAKAGEWVPGAGANGGSLSFSDFGGNNKPITVGEGRTANSVPTYQQPGYVSGSPAAPAPRAPTPYNPADLYGTD